ncbi:MAG: hypothetical protein JW829_12300 [Pirellulales bacterium]|nr:hypothetical protein [Pirellulales bacterium]
MWERLEPYAIAPLDPSLLKHAELVQLIKQVQADGPDLLNIVHLGDSVEGRAIHRIDFGGGPKKVLLWSQMHGDEPTHTAVLLNLINYLHRARREVLAESIRAGCTIQMIPMLNPDGAEQGTRQNAQGLDINRDARQLETPEGRILKRAVDSFQPEFAFNLHNQNPRNSISTTGQPAAVSLMVPPVDPEGSQTEQIRTAKKVVISFMRAVDCYCHACIGRYTADYMHEAFGETIQQQGAATVLVEAGGWPADRTPSLVAIHSVGLLATLESLATDAYVRLDPAGYDSMPMTIPHDSKTSNELGETHAQ